jgi:hypothetical protein
VVETHGLQLVGLDYMNADEDTFDLHPSDDSRTIKSVLASLHLKDGMPSVLLHHSPAGAQDAAANGIDLMIAGHTRRAVRPRHARGKGDFSIHSRPVSPRPPAGLRVARGRDVHVSRSTRHLKRAEHPAIQADTVVMII